MGTPLHHRETTFQGDVSRRALVERVLRLLARDVAAEAKAEGYRGRTVTTKLRFADFETLTRQITLRRPTNTRSVVERAALQCLDRIVLAKKVRLAGVRLSGLEGAGRTPS
jgi:DNA polymerase-4